MDGRQCSRHDGRGGGRCRAVASGQGFRGRTGCRSAAGRAEELQRQGAPCHALRTDDRHGAEGQDRQGRAARHRQDAHAHPHRGRAGPHLRQDPRGRSHGAQGLPGLGAERLPGQQQARTARQGRMGPGELGHRPRPDRQGHPRHHREAWQRRLLQFQLRWLVARRHLPPQCAARPLLQPAGRLVDDHWRLFGRRRPGGAAHGDRRHGGLFGPERLGNLARQH